MKDKREMRLKRWGNFHSSFVSQVINLFPFDPRREPLVALDAVAQSRFIERESRYTTEKVSAIVGSSVCHLCIPKRLPMIWSSWRFRVYWFNYGLKQFTRQITLRRFTIRRLSMKHQQNMQFNSMSELKKKRTTFWVNVQQFSVTSACSNWVRHLPVLVFSFIDDIDCFPHYELAWFDPNRNWSWHIPIMLLIRIQVNFIHSDFWNAQELESLSEQN
jgi:hypothetical protein